MAMLLHPRALDVLDVEPVEAPVGTVSRSARRRARRSPPPEKEPIHIIGLVADNLGSCMVSDLSTYADVTIIVHGGEYHDGDVFKPGFNKYGYALEKPGPVATKNRIDRYLSMRNGSNIPGYSEADALIDHLYHGAPPSSKYEHWFPPYLDPIKPITRMLQL